MFMIFGSLFRIYQAAIFLSLDSLKFLT